MSARSVGRYDEGVSHVQAALSDPPSTRPSARPSQAPLFTTEDVEREIRRLFGDDDGMLVVNVAGGGDGADDTYRQLMESLCFHYGSSEALGTSVVSPPDPQTLAKALRVLARPDLQRRAMDRLLSAFGYRLIEPLRAFLDAGPEGAVMAELVAVRERIVDDVARLGVTPETQRILRDDVERLLTDDYLTMLAENEERVQQPRVRALAQHILSLLGELFHRALQSWPANADRIAHAVTRSIGPQARLRELPRLVRDHIVAGIEEFLWVETSVELEGALGPLFATHADMVTEPPPLDRALYRELAEGCWQLIAEHG